MEDNCSYSFLRSSLHDISSYLTNFCPYSCLINVLYSEVLLPVQGLPCPGASSPQCCGSESESERIRAFFAESESEIFVPDSDSDPNSDPDSVN